MHIVAVNGCCYGRDNKPDKGEYYKYCGQVFWEFISGDDELYRDIIEPLGHQTVAMINGFCYNANNVTVSGGSSQNRLPRIGCFVSEKADAERKSNCATYSATRLFACQKCLIF